MSALLDEIIAARKDKAIAYEDYLQQVAALAKQVAAGKAADTSAQIDTPGRFALYNLALKAVTSQGIVAETGNPYLPDIKILALAIDIDTAIKQVRSDD
ncbi:hypothetical protein [Chamaesiphon sp. GL140_3_metabinner_50]|uniref:hypothetical protein n=1 Tax=Chamaesiphon sp. GL140_3_metabinner_50 TaxID=2970812 RepID=UPI0025DB9C59|nr:hypothetical protein [Chamaesiphon sp. GL140_3_metabinner_50]